jgi:hypothetical protein
MATTTDPPTTTEELDEARDRLRHEKLEREFDGDPDGQLFEAPSQLSFNLGAGRGNAPAFGTLKITGSLRVPRDLLYQEHVSVRIIDSRGELVAEAEATVDWPAFNTKDTLTERIHTAAIDY